MLLRLTLFVGLLHLVKCTAAQKSPSAPPTPKYVCTAEGWINNDDTCYHVLERTAKWHDAQAMCELLKAKFAYVDDQGDMDALAQAATLRSAPTVWLMGTNTDHQSAGTFIWRDAGRTEIDGSVTRWASGYPKPNALLDQFVYMKVDLVPGSAAGLAHSTEQVHRFVACMLPAKDITTAAAERLARVLNDPLHQTAAPVRIQKRSQRRQQQNTNLKAHLSNRRARKHKVAKQMQFAEADDDNQDVVDKAGKLKNGIVDASSSVGKKVKNSAVGAGNAIAGSGTSRSLGISSSGLYFLTIYLLTNFLAVYLL